MYNYRVYPCVIRATLLRALRTIELFPCWSKKWKILWYRKMNFSGLLVLMAGELVWIESECPRYRGWFCDYFFEQNVLILVKLEWELNSVEKFVISCQSWIFTSNAKQTMPLFIFHPEYPDFILLFSFSFWILERKNIPA